jgi:hypothetical protein
VADHGPQQLLAGFNFARFEHDGARQRLLEGQAAEQTRQREPGLVGLGAAVDQPLQQQHRALRRPGQTHERIVPLPAAVRKYRSRTTLRPTVVPRGPGCAQDVPARADTVTPRFHFLQSLPRHCHVKIGQSGCLTSSATVQRAAVLTSPLD